MRTFVKRTFAMSGSFREGIASTVTLLQGVSRVDRVASSRTPTFVTRSGSGPADGARAARLDLLARIPYAGSVAHPRTTVEQPTPPPGLRLDRECARVGHKFKHT